MVIMTLLSLFKSLMKQKWKNISAFSLKFFYQVPSVLERTKNLQTSPSNMDVYTFNSSHSCHNVSLHPFPRPGNSGSVHLPNIQHYVPVCGFSYIRFHIQQIQKKSSSTRSYEEGECYPTTNSDTQSVQEIPFLYSSSSYYVFRGFDGGAGFHPDGARHVGW